MNLETEEAGSRGFYFANFAEREDNKYVSLDESVKELDGYNSNKKYYAYKFKDKESGLTIGELKAIDKDFAKMWDALNKKASESYKEIKYEKDGEEISVSDSTKIDGELKLKLGNPTVVQP